MKWTTKEGKTSDIEELSTEHLENILNVLKKRHGKIITKGYGYAIADEIDGDVWEEKIDCSKEISAVSLELRLRKIEQDIKTLKGGAI